jgi:hypothetical protein
MPPVDPDTLSPELALVDPELAARARAALGVPVAARPESEAGGREPAAAQPSRSSRRLATPVLTLLATAAASLIVTSFTGPEHASGESPTVAAPARGAGLAAQPAPADSPSTGSTQAGDEVDAPSSSSATPSADDEVASTLATSGTAAAPQVAPAVAPAPRVAPSPTTLVWPRSAKASSYDLELVRGESVIFSQRSRSPQVVLPREWRRGGVRYTIQPEDQAFVWPVVDGRRAATPVVNGALALDMTLVGRFVGPGPSGSRP